jgi:thiol-disulfide isomerase/thioredoxin
MPRTSPPERRARLGVLCFFFWLFTASLLSQTVETIDRKKLLSLISERNNRPLLLNIWATWCKPCVEEFPDIVRLSNKVSDIDVAAISVNFPDEIEEKILPFVKEMNVPFKVYVADFADQDEFFSMFDKAWGGEIPATFIYSDNGTLKKFLRGKQSFAKLKKAVEEVVKKR